ncbi:hypothetical protein DID88_001699 [Monilinia fructigena]|uniref:Uncharacterized protein n=1 Tax=Monilinia fructigena TaxID=38457 RepID=A0A395IXF0_9HELO|nr:hypothetical protein DID88_001699 [Monilinia fructigena]
MSSNRFYSGQMTHHRNRPRHSIHRLSELAPRLEALRAASAVNQAKTECRQGDYLEELTKRRYMGEVAEEKVEHIRDSFATLNERIGQLHQPGPRAKNKTVEIDDGKDEDYNGDGGVRYRRLTAEEEQEDEQHWLQTVDALPKDTRMTEYYVEMGYQMGPALSSRRDLEKQQSPVSHSAGTARSVHPKKLFVPSIPSNQRDLRLLPEPTKPTSLLRIRIGTSSRDNPSFDRSLYDTSIKVPSVSSTDPVNQMHGSEASSSTLAPSPSKRQRPDLHPRESKCAVMVYMDVKDDFSTGGIFLVSQDQKTREFAMAKYDRDLEKSGKDRADLMIEPQDESQSSIKNWIMKLAHKCEKEDSINIPEASPVADPGGAGKRTFDGFDNDGEKAEEQKDRKRKYGTNELRYPGLQAINQCQLYISQSEDGKTSQYSWQDPGRYGYDENYYATDETIERKIYQVPSVAPGFIESSLQYHVDNNDASPPLRRQTPVQFLDSPMVSQDPSHYGDGNNSGRPLRRHTSLSRRSPLRTGHRVLYSPRTLSSPNRSRAVTSSIFRINGSKVSPRDCLNKKPSTI